MAEDEDDGGGGCEAAADDVDAVTMATVNTRSDNLSLATLPTILLLRNQITSKTHHHILYPRERHSSSFIGKEFRRRIRK